MQARKIKNWNGILFIAAAAAPYLINICYYLLTFELRRVPYTMDVLRPVYLRIACHLLAGLLLTNMIIVYRTDAVRRLYLIIHLLAVLLIGALAFFKAPYGYPTYEVMQVNLMFAGAYAYLLIRHSSAAGK